MRRNLASVLALGVFVTLAFGSNQDFMEGFEEGYEGGYDDAWGEPAGDVETHITELSQLKGRQIWMVNAPKRECDKMEALGMVVDCEQGRDLMGMEDEIVIWCQEFGGGIAKKILDHLGHSDFEIRTWDEGGHVDNSECGELFEVTIRYQEPK